MTYDLKTIQAKSLMPGNVCRHHWSHQFSAKWNVQVVNRFDNERRTKKETKSFSIQWHERCNGDNEVVKTTRQKKKIVKVSLANRFDFFSIWEMEEKKNTRKKSEIFWSTTPPLLSFSFYHLPSRSHSANNWDRDREKKNPFYRLCPHILCVRRLGQRKICVVSVKFQANRKICLVHMPKSFHMHHSNLHTEYIIHEQHSDGKENPVQWKLFDAQSSRTSN